MKRNSKMLREWVQSDHKLNELWEETESVIPNCTLAIYSMQEYTQITRIDRSASHYAFCHVVPMPNTLYDKQYGAAIIVADDAINSDIAHELCHLYIHGNHGYPWIWLDDNFKKEQQTVEIQQQAFYATRIYDIAVHPIIDQILQERCLLDPIIFNRMYNTYLEELKKYLKNPLNGNKFYVFTRTIELQKRLPIELLNAINKEFGFRNSYSNLLGQIQQLPKYPDKPAPDSIYQYILDMWRAFEIKPDSIHSKLLMRTPLLNP